MHAGEAGRVSSHFPQASISQIDLFYPDPWPKRRQKKRRFVSDEMLATFARLLKPGGLFRFATDIDDYAGWTLARIARSPDFVWEAGSAQDWQTPYEGWQSTRYEEKALREGRVPAYFTFRRR
jgi:tRNA (guanine-N7-)-methyltransferase